MGAPILKPMQWVDIGVNLTHRRFAADAEAVLDRATAAGVTQVLLTGTSVAGSERAAALAASRPGRLFSTAGVHPHDAQRAGPDSVARLRALAGRPEVVAVGECGLDFDRDLSPRPVQEAVFADHLGLAAELGLPVFLHQRAAHTRFLALLSAHRAALTGVVVHCFTGPRSELDAYLALGCHIGVTGWLCDERRGVGLREALPHLPLNRLLLETDAPFLCPRDLRPKPRGGRNEPAFLPHIAHTAAVLLGRPVEEIAAASTRNARALFDLPTP